MKNFKGLIAFLVSLTIGMLLGIWAHSTLVPSNDITDEVIAKNKEIKANLDSLNKQIASKQIALANLAKLSLPDSIPDQNKYEYIGLFQVSVDVVDPKDIYSEGNSVVNRYSIPITAEYYEATRDTMPIESWQTVYNPSGSNIEAINISKLILIKRTKRKL